MNTSPVFLIFETNCMYSFSFIWSWHTETGWSKINNYGSSMVYYFWAVAMYWSNLWADGCHTETLLALQLRLFVLDVVLHDCIEDNFPAVVKNLNYSLDAWTSGCGDYYITRSTIVTLPFWRGLFRERSCCFMILWLSKES